MPPITLTRQQLYDRAWTTPLDTWRWNSAFLAWGLGKLLRAARISGIATDCSGLFWFRSGEIAGLRCCSSSRTRSYDRIEIGSGIDGSFYLLGGDTIPHTAFSKN